MAHFTQLPFRPRTEIICVHLSPAHPLPIELPLTLTIFHSPSPCHQFFIYLVCDREFLHGNLFIGFERPIVSFATGWCMVGQGVMAFVIAGCSCSLLGSCFWAWVCQWLLSLSSMGTEFECKLFGFPTPELAGWSRQHPDSKPKYDSVDSKTVLDLNVVSSLELT